MLYAQNEYEFLFAAIRNEIALYPLSLTKNGSLVSAAEVSDSATH